MDMLHNIRKRRNRAIVIRKAMNANVVNFSQVVIPAMTRKMSAAPNSILKKLLA